MAVRKNFVFDEEVAAHLEELARESGKSMTRYVADLIEEKHRSKRVKERLEAFERFCGSGDGLFRGKSVQNIKAEMDG